MLRALAIAAVAAIASPTHGADLRLFTLGSGELGGSYFAAADAICDIFNAAHRGVMRCSPEATPGSLYNIASLREQQLDFALMQSDWQKAAFAGDAPFAAQGPMENLRSVMSLYPETITVIARPDAGVASIADLQGKRVDIGPPASGRQATVSRILAAMDLPTTYFAAVLTLASSASVDALCEGQIDAAILIVGHPNASIRAAMDRCDARLIPAAGPRLAAVMEGSQEYAAVVIPRATYPQLEVDIPTYAAIATLVTRADIAADIVEALVGSTLDSLPELAMRAPVLAGLNPEMMGTRGLTAPLHPGAQAAFETHAAKP